MSSDAEARFAAAEKFITALQDFILTRHAGDLAAAQKTYEAALSSEDATRPTGDKEKAAPKDGLS